MNVSYDTRYDSLYITLNDKPVVASQMIGHATVIDLDEFGEVIGIHVIAPREREIDPFHIQLETLTEQTPRREPTEAELAQLRQASQEAHQRYRERHNLEKT